MAVGLALLALPASAIAGTAPVLTGSVSNANSANGPLAGLISVAVSGNYAYATSYSGGALTAIDISNRAHPAVVGSSAPFLDTNLLAGSNVAISGGYAFVVSKNRNASTTNNDDGNGNSLTILDIHTDPTHPAIVGTPIQSSSQLFGAYGIAVSNGYAYVAYQGVLSGQPASPDTSTGGFSVIDLNATGGPAIVANIDNGSLPAPYTGTNALQHATSVAISPDGNYAYVNAFYGNRITVIDISNPTSPTIKASLHDNTNLAFVVDLAIQGNYLYAADQVGGSSPQLTVLDISTPTSPHVVGSLSNATHLNGAYRIHVRGSFAYESASSVATVGAIDISDPQHPRLAGYVNNANLHTTTGLDLDSTGAYVAATSPYLATESGPTYPPYPFQTGGPTIHGTLSVISIDPNPIAVPISSGPGSQTTQTSASFTFTPSDDVALVRCQLDTGAFTPCTSQTSQSYSGLALGSHTFTVQATDAQGNTNSDTYTWQVETAPQNNGAPTIDAGPATVGQTVNLTSSGTWSGTPTPSLSYQWDRCDQAGANCQTMSGQTGTSYTVGQADAGATIALTVTGTNGVGTASSTSSATDIVTGPPVSTGAPTISGTAAVGNTLNATHGSWSGYPAPTYSYQWNDCPASGPCTPVASGGTGASYTVQGSDVGSALQVVVTASNGVGTPGTSSAQTAPVGAVAPGNTAPPTIDAGPATVGQTVHWTSDGSWTGAPAPTFTYQWDRCDQSGANCQAISGQTGTSYVIGSGDAGSTIALTVTATNSAGVASKTSAATNIVTGAPVSTGAPTISGTAAVGNSLSATHGSWSGYPAPTYSYQWNDCPASGSCTPVASGGTGASYTVQSSDVGFSLQVVVTASNGVGTPGTASAQTAPVGTVAPHNTAAPTIDAGPATVGQTVHWTSDGSWTGAPAPTYSYQWDRCNQSGSSCQAISGQTGKSYVIGSGDAGSTIALTVTATNSAGAVPATSPATGAVTMAPSNTSAPAIGGNVTVGQVVTASAGNWSGFPAPAPSGYQWQDCTGSGTCTSIVGAQAATYTVKSTDAGSALRVLVTEANSAGSSTAASPQIQVKYAPSNTVAPAVSGTLVQGSTLRATTGTWRGYPAPGLTVQWQRCTTTACASITGATGLTYVLKQADVGARMRVVVTAINSVGSATKASAMTGTVRSGASAVLRAGAKTSALRVSVKDPSSGHTAWQVIISAPKRRSFMKSARQLTRGVQVRDSHNKLLHVLVALRSGQLIISLRGPALPVHIVLSANIVKAKH